jgi:lauroyl/myristoyl acyltransferase
LLSPFAHSILLSNVTKLLIHATGWLVARTPQVFLRLLAGLLGRVILLIPKRRGLLFSNLHHAFPGKPRAWRARVARLSCARLIETGMLSLASPFFSEARIRRMAALSPQLEAIMRARAAEGGGRPLLIGTLHFAYWECLTWLGLLCPGIAGTGVIFRPLKNPALNAWVKQTRERHGVLLLSRKNGLQDAFRIMRRGGVVSLLFDQNAGGNGALTLLLGRVCSTSELAGTLAEKFGAKVVVFYPRRLGFWAMRFEAVEIETDGTADGATLALNCWLETLLANDDEFRASWLWSHGRWRTQDVPAQRLRLEARRDLLDADLAARGLTRATMPRGTRFWITMPGSEADAAAALPLLRRLRRSRPDAEITLLAEAAFAGLLENAAAAITAPGIAAGVADKVVFLPPPGPARRRLVRRLRSEFPDTHLLLADSAEADREARLINAPQRFGL